MKTKIIIATILLLLTLGVVSATMDDFQTPSGWELINNGIYKGPTDNEGIMVFDYTPLAVKEYLTPSSTLKIDKQPDNTIIFDDTKNNEHGVAEVVTMDGDKYIIMFWATSDGMSDEELMNVMVEFNSLNHVTPMSIGG